MHKLQRMFQPASIAHVGASNDPEKAGYHMFDSLKEFPGKLYPVNHNSAEIQGITAYPDLKSIGSPIDLLVLTIPAEFCSDVIQEAGEIGTGAVLISGGGFEESGKKGRELQDKIVAMCRNFGIRILGPNTSGFINLEIGLKASFNPLVKKLHSGSISIVSQSGAMGVILSTVVQSINLGVDITVGSGNAPDVSISDIIEYLADRPSTHVIALYLEGVEDGRRLYETIRKTVPKKPVVVFTVGRADIDDFAKSHTGKMIGSYELKAAALRQAGAVVASSSNDLIDAAHILSMTRLSPAENPGVGILTGQAGPGMIIMDYLRRRKVYIPELKQETRRRISEELPLKTFIRNPVDTARPEHESFFKVFSYMADDPDIDVLIAFAMHEPMCVDPEDLFERIRLHTKKPIIFGTSGLPEDIDRTIQDLDALMIPSFVSPDRTAQAAWALIEDAKARHRLNLAMDHPHINVVRYPAEVSEYIDEGDAKNIIEAIGIPVPDRMLCDTHDEAEDFFRTMKKPGVLKISSPHICHKTEIGGICLSLSTEKQFKSALDKIDAIEIPDNSRRYLIEQMAPEGIDVIIGAKNDSSFGPTVMIGLGGVVAEAYNDVAMRIAPISHREALEMISELKSGILLGPWRRQTSYDRDAVADALVRIGDFIYNHPELRAIDLNPVRVYQGGLLALDALMVSHSQFRQPV